MTVEPRELRERRARLVAVMVEGDNESLKRLAGETGGVYTRAELDERGALRILDTTVSQ